METPVQHCNARLCLDRCGTCRWSATSQTQLQAHLEEHDGYKPHVCHECKATFTTDYSMRVHARMHDKGKSTCACDACGANFNTVLNLTRHRRQCPARTADTKPFLCRLCLASFWHHHKMLRHVRAVHTLEQPFKCEVCVSSFSSRRTLDNHVSKVHRYAQGIKKFVEFDCVGILKITKTFSSVLVHRAHSPAPSVSRGTANARS